MLFYHVQSLYLADHVLSAVWLGVYASNQIRRKIFDDTCIWLCPLCMCVLWVISGKCITIDKLMEYYYIHTNSILFFTYKHSFCWHEMTHFTHRFTVMRTMFVEWKHFVCQQRINHGKFSNAKQHSKSVQKNITLILLLTILQIL